MLVSMQSGRLAKFFCFSLLSLFLKSVSLGATISATSAQDVDVQNAVNASKNGDTVLIPAGMATWTVGVNTGSKSLTMAGAGIDVTIITNNVSTTTAALTVPLTSSSFFTLSNCSFATIPSSQNGIVNIGGSSPKCQFRVSNCKFYVAPANVTVGYRSLTVNGTYGLIDHCYFRNTSGGGHGIDAGYDGNGVIGTNWYISQVYGDTNTVCVEDCVFDFDQMADDLMDVYSGCKFVLRYCTITNTAVGWHGADSDARGVRLFEIYQNKYYTKNGYTVGEGALARSGSGVMWGNTLDAGYKNLFMLRVYRADPNYTGWFGSQFMYLPSGGLQGPCNDSRIVDGNFDSSGYPALDQVGRGSFPANAVSWRTNFTSAQYEALEGVYQWGNNLNGNTGPKCTIADYGYTPNITNFLKAGRDYFDNTPKPGYTPLAYPHPLITASTGGSAPGITSQPQPQSVAVGQTATFSVTAGGSAPLAYQWYVGSTAISGATLSSYAKTNCQLTDTGGSYSVIVSNQFGTAQSTRATLTVLQAGTAPAITSQPTNQAVTVGQTATFAVTATGTAPLSYQWYFKSNLVAGATQNGFTKTNCQLSDAGAYYAIVTNSYGTAQSSAAILTASQGGATPAIAGQPANQTVTAGQAATFSVSATGTAPLAYTWRFNGSPVGSNSSSYVRSNCQLTDSGGSVTVGVTNALGGVLSSAAALTVLQAGGGSQYYVSTNGSDTNPGTLVAPWRTINYAFSRIAGGDTIWVQNGTYNEDGLYIYGPSGAVGAPTTLRAYPGHHPVFQGLGNSGRIAIDGVGYVTIDGMEIYNLNQMLYIRNGAHDITIRNCNIHDSGNELIRVANNCSNVLFELNQVHDSATLGGINGEGFYIGTAPSSGPDNTSYVTVRSNTVYNTISEGIEFKPGTHDCVAEGNTMYNCSTVDPYRTIEIDEVANWNQNPNHIVRNNVLHDTKTPIRAGTGCRVYNNVIYGISSAYYAIMIDNASVDPYTRAIYCNTMDVPSALAISIGGGTADIRNNIGPSSAFNLATSTNYYVNAAGHNYHLVAGSAPIAAGADLSSVVPVDFDGNARPSGSPSDIGAFEYIAIRPLPPTGLRIVGP